MAIMDGCEGNAKTWVLEEKECPQCGRILEYYTVKGRVVEDAVCDCGYVLKAQEPVITVRKDEK